MVRACVLLASMRFSPGTGAQPPNHPLFFYDKRESEGGRRAERRRTSYITKENIWGKKIKRRRRSSLALYRERASMLYPPSLFFTTPPEDVFDVRYRRTNPSLSIGPSSLSLFLLSLIDTHIHPLDMVGCPLHDPFPLSHAGYWTKQPNAQRRGGKKSRADTFFPSKKRSVITFTASVGCLLYYT